MMSPLTTHAQRGMYIPLPHADQEATVSISLQKGSLKVIAWDKAAVEYKVQGDGGIINSDDGNEVMIKVEGDDSVSLMVFVPRNCHLIVKSFQSGPIDIKEVKGTLEVDAYNGSVKLMEIEGNALISAWNGPIFASFKAVNDKPMAFTSYNGEIKLLIPHDTNAKIFASYQNGSLTNDFALPKQKDGIMEMAGIEAETPNGDKRWDQFTLGTGGPEWRVRNLNGDVQILKW